MVMHARTQYVSLQVLPCHACHAALRILLCTLIASCPYVPMRMGLMMLHMQEMARASGDDDPDWDEILRDAAHTNPVCGPWLQTLSLFVRRGAGELLQDLNRSFKVFPGSEEGNRMIGSEFFGKLNSLSWGKLETFPYMENAFIKANLAGHKTVDNICKTIPPSALQLAKSEKKRPMVREAEALMEASRSMVDALGLDPDESFRHICTLDVRLALLVTNRQNSDDGVFNDCDEIGKARLFQQTKRCNMRLIHTCTSVYTMVSWCTCLSTNVHHMFVFALLLRACTFAGIVGRSGR